MTSVCLSHSWLHEEEVLKDNIIKAVKLSKKASIILKVGRVKGQSSAGSCSVCCNLPAPLHHLLPESWVLDTTRALSF